VIEVYGKVQAHNDFYVRLKNANLPQKVEGDCGIFGGICEIS